MNIDSLKSQVRDSVERDIPLMAVTPAFLQTILDELEGAKFAACQHLHTVKSQAEVLANKAMTPYAPPGYRLVPVVPSQAIKDAIREQGHFQPVSMWEAIIARVDLVASIGIGEDTGLPLYRPGINQVEKAVEQAQGVPSGWTMANAFSIFQDLTEAMDAISNGHQDSEEIARLMLKRTDAIHYQFRDAAASTTPDAPTCVCASPKTAGVTHRTDGPCYVKEPTLTDVEIDAMADACAINWVTDERRPDDATIHEFARAIEAHLAQKGGA